MTHSSRVTAQAMLLAGILAACSGGGGGSSSPTPSSPQSPPPPPPPAAPSAISVTRFEEQAVQRGIVHGFGYTDDMDQMARQFSGGAAAGDVDGDGDIDLLIVRGNTGPNLLYLNQGGVEFREDALGAGVAYTKDALRNYRHSGPVLGDLDGDGDLDLFIGGLENDPSKVFQNDGNGVFTDVTAGSGIDGMTSKHTVSAALGDYDLDGDLDLAMAHWGTPRDPNNPGETETLWRNDSSNGQLRFTPISAAAGISANLALDLENSVYGGGYDYTFAPSFVDIDNDGDPDLLSVSDFGGSRVFRNDGNNVFSDVTNESTITDENGMGSAVGDYDNDGDIDWFVSSINGNRLYENTGGAFVLAEPGNANVSRGGWGWGACFADFNADSFLDIYQTNGWFAGQDPSSSQYVEDRSHLWMSSGNGSFEDKAEEFEIIDAEQGRGIVCDDFDNDGDVDVLLLTSAPQQSALLWINELTDPNYVSLKLDGLAPNTSAIGARIQVITPNMTQIRYVGINSNFTSHNSAVQYFGLGDATEISRIVVDWPDGLHSEYTDIQAERVVTISHPSK